ncbi:MAG TPA: hypothetical protein VLD36_07205 [Burkholderiales bacterium]|nr:hypothetical protein [Burkholderiales bacterium]
MNPAPADRPAPGPTSAESLNRGCACRTLDPQRLIGQLESDPALAGLHDEIAHRRPHLFSATAVFISERQLERVAALVDAIERIVALPDYQEQALVRAPLIARHRFGPRAVFLGFDFHLGKHGPQLIEINTNAGGALLNGALARAQQACCREMEWAFHAATDLGSLEPAFFNMFAEEWRLQRGDAPLGRVAIVDDDPASQYLFPEFQHFERLFRRHGLAAVVADARALEWKDDTLCHAGEPVDLVYNRLTDFYLQAPEHAALRAAYEAGAAVVTPHPRAHAIYADKRNLITLSSEESLTALGVPPPVRAILLAGVPRTEAVTAARAEALWAERRKLFFKPASGFGSKAAYRGDKLTRRVWEEILAGDYVAQAVAPPSERLVEVDGTESDLKLDLRGYVYQGAIQLLAARLYAGQTTNFRTPGGGFAPVFVAPERDRDSVQGSDEAATASCTVGPKCLDPR